MHWFYLWFMLSIGVGIFAACQRERDGFGWFVLSLLLSPLVAGVLVIALPSRAPRIYITDDDAIERQQRTDVRTALIGAPIAILLIIGLFILLFQSAYAQQSRSFYDRSGGFAGSSATRGNSSSFYDKSGRFDGSAIRNSDGTTSFYDKSGRFIGSSTNTTQAK
jgi:hypothetical protein